jgi:hypothetical protein
MRVTLHEMYPTAFPKPSIHCIDRYIRRFVTLTFAGVVVVLVTVYRLRLFVDGFCNVMIIAIMTVSRETWQSCCHHFKKIIVVTRLHGLPWISREPYLCVAAYSACQLFQQRRRSSRSAQLRSVGNGIKLSLAAHLLKLCTTALTAPYLIASVLQDFRYVERARPRGILASLGTIHGGACLMCSACPPDSATQLDNLQSSKPSMLMCVAEISKP